MSSVAQKRMGILAPRISLSPDISPSKGASSEVEGAGTARSLPIIRNKEIVDAVVDQCSWHINSRVSSHDASVQLPAWR